MLQYGTVAELVPELSINYYIVHNIPVILVVFASHDDLGLNSRVINS